jgi:hypothetical protein
MNSVKLGDGTTGEAFFGMINYIAANFIGETLHD